MTVNRGEWEEGEWRKIGEGLSRNMYKGHMDKAKGGRFKGKRQGWVGWGTVVGKNGDKIKF